METFKSSNGSPGYLPQQTQDSNSMDVPILILAFVALVVVYISSQILKWNGLHSLGGMVGPPQNIADASHSNPPILATAPDFAFPAARQGTSPQRTPKIRNQYRTLSEVQSAIQQAGLESSNLILAIDFTKSNTWTGAETFDGYSLHDTTRKGVENPYQKVMRIIARTLNKYDEDTLIPAFGFGDIYTKGNSCFPFFPDRPCHGLQEVLERYEEIVGDVQLSGPTNFAPVINKAAEIVRERGDYHILLIIADGQVDKVKDTVDAIVAASNHPLSIVCVGVGDGPWDTMEHFDDQIPQRRFDNFQFVNMRALEAAHASAGVERLEAEFACAALMELPEQYAAMRRLSVL